MKGVSCLLVTAVTALCVLVYAEGRNEMSIGRRFHYETSFGDSGLKGATPYFGRKVSLYKRYKGAKKVSLPASRYSGLTVERAIKLRRSIRGFKKKPLSLDQLARLLISADGITSSRGGLAYRAAPSGGALYPIETYILAHNVTDLMNGLYHFQVADTSLELVKEGEFASDIHRAAGEQDAVGASPVTLVLTARFDRSTAKYADRGFRYVYMEAGAIAENISLQAVSLRLGTVVVGAFNDDATNQVIGVDGTEEAALVIMPVGVPR